MLIFNPVPISSVQFNLFLSDRESREARFDPHGDQLRIYADIHNTLHDLCWETASTGEGLTGSDERFYFFGRTDKNSAILLGYTPREPSVRGYAGRIESYAEGIIISDSREEAKAEMKRFEAAMMRRERKYSFYITDQIDNLVSA